MNIVVTRDLYAIYSHIMEECDIVISFLLSVVLPPKYYQNNIILKLNSSITGISI